MALNAQRRPRAGRSSPARPLVVSRARTAAASPSTGGPRGWSSSAASSSSPPSWPSSSSSPPRSTRSSRRRPRPLAGDLGAAADGVGARRRASALGVDEYREIAYVVTRGGALEFCRSRAAGSCRPCRRRPSTAARDHGGRGAGKGRHLLGTADGRVIPLEVKFDVTFKDGARTVIARSGFGEPPVVDPSARRPVRAWPSRRPPTGPVDGGAGGPGRAGHADGGREEGADRRRAARRSRCRPLPVTSTARSPRWPSTGAARTSSSGPRQGQGPALDLRDRAAARARRRSRRRGAGRADHRARLPARRPHPGGRRRRRAACPPGRSSRRPAAASGG